MGDLCLAINLSTLNRHLVVPHVQMETAHTIRAASWATEWPVFIDICNAYLHVPMSPVVWKCLCFCINKGTYQFTCPPFGLATSPREFIELLWLAVQLLHLLGIYLHVYLDNWLTRGGLHRDGEFPCTTNQPSVAPSRMDDQLWKVRVNTHRGLLSYWNALPDAGFYGGFPTEDENQGSSLVILDQWRFATTVPALDVHRMLGTIQYMALLVPRGRLHFRPIQCWAIVAWNQTYQRTGPNTFTFQIGLSISWRGGLPQHSAKSYDNTVHGCFPVWVGSTARQPENQRPLVSSSAVKSYQHPGVGGSHLCCQTLPEQITWERMVWCATMQQWCYTSNRKTGRNHSGWLVSPSGYWNFVTRRGLSSIQFTSRAVATYKHTVCHGWVRHSQQSGRLITVSWIQCSNDGDNHGLICSRLTGTGSANSLLDICVSSFTGTSRFVTFIRATCIKIVKVVKTAYQASDEILPEKVTVHELRALASSWVYNCHIAL